MLDTSGLIRFVWRRPVFLSGHFPHRQDSRHTKAGDLQLEKNATLITPPVLDPRGREPSVFWLEIPGGFLVVRGKWGMLGEAADARCGDLDGVAREASYVSI